MFCATVSRSAGTGEERSQHREWTSYARVVDRNYLECIHRVVGNEAGATQDGAVASAVDERAHLIVLGQVLPEHLLGPVGVAALPHGADGGARVLRAALEECAEQCGHDGGGRRASEPAARRGRYKSPGRPASERVTTSS